MLQVVHEKKGSARASSLYCQWIRVERAGEERLVAVWIDSEMRAFAEEHETAAHAELQEDSLAGEPDPRCVTGGGSGAWERRVSVL